MPTLAEPAVGRCDVEPREERRAELRYPCRVRVFYQPGVGKLEGFWWRATVIDISTNGLGLLLSHGFELGTLLTIEMPAIGSQAPRRLGARVVHVTPAARGCWTAGCVVVSKLGTNEVSDLC
jgi:hypothetical protein